MSYERKHPLLLRNNSYFTKLTVLDSHEKVFYNGVSITLNFIRAPYWIIKGRQTVKSILRKCVTCKLVHGKTVTPPKEPSLPSFRVDYTYPFETVGTDYAGPMFHKFTNGRNVEMKKYLLLITCTSTRAAHLEVTTDVNANSLFLALHRFFARKDIPNMIISDNFKAFKVQSVKCFGEVFSIKWKFILERSRWWWWWGGIL